MTVADHLAPTGTLRVAINVGNPVLAQADPGGGDPRGVSVELAREVARRLDVPVSWHVVDAARLSLAALVDGQADLAFLAVDPDRGRDVAFTRPYVVIEGVFVVPAGSALVSAADVDREGVRVGVKEGSAYDLHLSRELQQADVVRGGEGTTTFLEEGLEAGAGIRGPVAELADERGDLRVLEPSFMQIEQALAVPRDCPPGAVAWLDEVVAELLAGGPDSQVGRWLAATGQASALAAR